MLKIFLWIDLLFLAGCSTFGAGNHASLTLTPIQTSISVGNPAVTLTPIQTSTSFAAITPTPVPTLLLFTGKIAFMVWKDMIHSKIYVMKANGTEQTDITPPNLPEIRDLAWSLDGQYLAFDAIVGQVNQIFKIKSDGSGLVQLTFREENAWSPSWSPDGKHIMFVSSSPDILGNTLTTGGENQPVSQIYVMKVDGSDVRRFTIKTRDNNVQRTGQYRNDGLISVSEPISRQGLTNYVVDSNGVIQKQFPEFVSESPPVWSPDGNFFILSFSPSSDCSSESFIMKFDDTQESCIMVGHTTEPLVPGVQGWSPDGNYILLATNLVNNHDPVDLYVMKPDASDLTRLTYFSTRLGDAVWSATP